MTTNELPALSLAAMPRKRRATLEIAAEIERRGFSGIYCPSFGDGIGLCEALAFVTHEIPFGTSIANLYTRHPHDYARSAAFIHELSGGRFRFGVGVSHAVMNRHYGIPTGKPIPDVRRFVDELRTGAKRDELPPVVLATLRKPMVRVAGEIAEGAVWANAARSHLPVSLAELTEEQRTGEGFFVGNMIPTCVTDDLTAAAVVLRKTLRGYVALPNYRRYWAEAGYGDEMGSIEQALERKDETAVAAAMTERWLRDTTLYGPASVIRDGVAAYREAGVKTPILVPSSTNGGQLHAVEEIFAAFA